LAPSGTSRRQRRKDSSECPHWARREALQTRVLSPGAWGRSPHKKRKREISPSPKREVVRGWGYLKSPRKSLTGRRVSPNFLPTRNENRLPHFHARDDDNASLTERQRDRSRAGIAANRKSPASHDPRGLSGYRGAAVVCAPGVPLTRSALHSSYDTRDSRSLEP